MIINIYEIFIRSIMLLIFLGVSVVVYIWGERKCIALMQNRLGPNRLGAGGILQLTADLIKLLFKHEIISRHNNKLLYLIIPGLKLVIAFLSWAVIPLNKQLVLSNLNSGLLYLLALQVLNLLLLIWGEYLVSAEINYQPLVTIKTILKFTANAVVMLLILIGVLLKTSSMNLTAIVYIQAGGINNWLCWSLLPLVYIYWAINIFENNYLFFWLNKSNLDLKSNLHESFAGISLALIILAEYCNNILKYAITVILFLGGWLSPFNGKFLSVPSWIWFIAKMLLVMIFYMLIKPITPKYRSDQILDLCWKKLIPFGLLWIILQAIWISL